MKFCNTSFTPWGYLGYHTYLELMWSILINKFLPPYLSWAVAHGHLRLSVASYEFAHLLWCMFSQFNIHAGAVHSNITMAHLHLFSMLVEYSSYDICKFVASLLFWAYITLTQPSIHSMLIYHGRCEYTLLKGQFAYYMCVMQSDFHIWAYASNIWH